MMHPFVERFRQAWSSRDPNRFRDLMHPDVELFQPLVPKVSGRDAGTRSIATFLEAIPDLTITILNASVAEPLAFIEFRFAGTVGSRPVQWDLTDRIELVDGLVKRRVSYFDPLPFLRAVLVQPRLWGRFIAATRRP